MQSKSDISAASPTTTLAGAELVARLEQLSSLIDDQASDDDAQQVSAAFAQTPELRVAWSLYQHVGDALRDGEHALPLASSAFAHGVLARLAVAPMDDVQTESPRGQHHTLRLEAVNDPVFRWKLVAGVATLAAVVAVAWQVALPSVAPSGTQWAQVTDQAQSRNTEAVLTQQGVLLRDPQLEALLAAHRQYAGQSALQMPAGFLRNATYEVSQR